MHKNLKPLQFLPLLLQRKLLLNDRALSLKEALSDLQEDIVFATLSGASVLTEDEIIKAVETDTLYLKDYEVVSDYIQKKQYKPFSCVFETSGEIIIENDLREYYPEGPSDYGGPSGIISSMKHYQSFEMLHGFVGNSCPSLCLSEEKGIIEIGLEYDEGIDDEKLPDPSYSIIGSVCTDLWWYSLADLKRFKLMNPEVDTSEFNTATIPAGMWRLEHYYGISQTGYHESVPYARLIRL